MDVNSAVGMRRGLLNNFFEWYFTPILRKAPVRVILKVWNVTLIQIA